jgi:hypothetical protein
VIRPVSLRDLISPSQILKSSVVTKISQTANPELPNFMPDKEYVAM